MPPAPPVEERFAIALQHARMAQGYEPDVRGAAIEFRKHLGWYVKGLPGSADLRRQLHAVNSFDEVEGIFASYLSGPYVHGIQPSSDVEGGTAELQVAVA